MEKMIFETSLELVSREIDLALTKSPRIINEYLTHLSLSKGKMIRAVSVLRCAEDQDGFIELSAVKVAAAIEIVHLASLVHDDIIDNADLRRGNETIQKKYGKRTAVICGDYLLSLALKMVQSIPNRKDYLEIKFPDYISRLCLGELNQHINNKNLNLSIFQYIKIIAGKTAALFEVSFFAGAIFSGATEKEIKSYRKIGFYIGIIFQLMDDCLDFETTVETIKKPVQSDFEQGVITLPLIHAFEQLPDFKMSAQQDAISRNEINIAVKKSGGLDFTKILIQKYYMKTMKNIETLNLTETKKNHLVEILDKASRKNK